MDNFSKAPACLFLQDGSLYTSKIAIAKTNESRSSQETDEQKSEGSKVRQCLCVHRSFGAPPVQRRTNRFMEEGSKDLPTLADDMHSLQHSYA